MQHSSPNREFVGGRRNPTVLDPSVPASPFEQRMARDSRWALMEASQFFEGTGAVQETLRKITTRLYALGIPYAVVGGLALFSHGLRRFTEDVVILVTHESLKAIHQELEGLGYLPPFDGSKNLRDTETGVKVEFFVTGGFPGDGKPKPVSFPDPVQVSVERDGIFYVNLPTLIELKIASGMTNTERMKDLADAQELIKILGLGKDFAQQLKPFVQEKFHELWMATRPPEKRYVSIWRNKFLTIDAKNIQQMIASLQDAAATLQAMLDDGVTLGADGRTGDDYAYLVTTDPTIAKKYDMHDEAEFWDEPNKDEPQDGNAPA